MSNEFMLKAVFGCLPVVTFLATLVHFDSFKLVHPKTVLMVTIAGAASAGIAYLLEIFMLDRMGIELHDLMHFGAPVVEELLTAIVIVILVQTNRIGFAFDAVILGFAAGTGFALIENFYYLAAPQDRDLAVWVIRGFGSAIMHGATTSVFALSGHLLAQHAGRARFYHYLPGLGFAVGFHTAFNYIFLDFPVISTVAMMIGLPAITALLLNRDKKTIQDWLKVDFDDHKQLLEQIRSGEYEKIAAGRFLTKLHERFDAYTVDKMIYYIELHTELIIAAEEILLAHANGKNQTVEGPIKEKLILLHEVEGEIGKTGMLALRPHLNFNRHEFWEIYMLEKEAGFAHPHAH